MPPLIVWALAAIGAVLVGRWITNEARRRSEMRARQEGVGRAERDQARKLERDPVTGVYRPK